MSNLRVKTIIPDAVSGPTNVINMPGDFRVAGTFTAATVTVTQALSLGNVLSVGDGVSFTNVPTNGNLPYLQPASNSAGLLLAGGPSGINSTLSARIALYGPQWPVPADANSINLAGPGKISLLAGSGTATTSSLLLGTNGVITATGSSLVVSGGNLTVGSLTDAASSTDVNASASFAGGLAVAKSLYAGTSITGQTVNVTGTGSSSISTAGGVQTQGDIRTATRVYAATGLTISTAGSATGDIRVYSTSTSSIWTDGGVIVGGGLSATGDIAAGAAISVVGQFRSTNGADALVDGTGAGVFAGGVSVGKSLRVTGTTNATGKLTGTAGEFTTSLLISDTTDTLSLGTGTVVVKSGISVNRSAFFGNTLNVTGAGTFSSTIAATGNITSSAIVSGASVTAAAGGITSAGIISGTSLTLSATTDGLTAGTGALIVAQGGMSVARSVRVGATFHVVGTGTFDSTVSIASDLQIASTGRLLAASTLDVALDGTGAPVTAGGLFTGGVYVGKTLQVGGAVNAAGAATMVGDVTGATFHTTGTGEASGLLSGAIYTAGGMSVSKKLYAGGAVTLQSTLTVSGTITFTNTSISSSPISGSVIMSGGLGVGGNVWSAGALNGATTEITGQSIVHGVAYFASTLDSSDPTTGSAVCLGGMGVAATLRVAGKAFIGDRAQLSAGLDIYGTVRGYDTTPSTTLQSGAVVLAGGVACGGNLNVGGSLSITGAATFLSTLRFTLLAESATPADGAAVFTGGVGIGRNLNVGGALSVAGAATIVGGITNTAGTLQLNSIAVSDGSGILNVKSAAPGLRVTGTAAIAAARYVNTIDLFTLGAAYTDTNTEAFQVTSTGATGYTLMSRATGTGTVRTMSLQAGATNTGQLMLNTDGSIILASSSTDAVTPAVSGTASVRVTGGLSVQASVAIGSKLALYPNATSSNAVTFRAAPSTVAYNLVMPPGLPTTANYALVSDTTGTLTWAQMTTANPSFTTVNVTAGTESGAPTSGSVIVNGGVGLSGNMSIGKLLRLFSNNGNDISFTAPAASTQYALTLPPTLPSANNYALTSSTTGVLSWSQMTTSNPTFQTVTITSGLTVQGTAAFGGQGIVVNSLTSGGGVLLVAPAVTPSATPLQLTLPASIPVSTTTQMLTSDQSGNLSFIDQPSLQTNSVTFLAANNVTTAQPVTGLLYTDYFQVDVFVTVTASSFTRTGVFVLRGFNSANGYQLFSTVVITADNESIGGIAFSINSTTGQVLYTSSNVAGWTSTVMRWSQTQMRSAQSTVINVDALNNITTATTIPGFVVPVDQFTREITTTVSTTAGVAARCVYRLTGVVQTGGQWVLSQQNVGVDTAGIIFSVTAAGQVQYTSGNVANWVRTTLNVNQPMPTSQSQAQFNRLEVLGSSSDSLLVDGGMTVVGDLTMTGGNLLPRVVSKVGGEAVAESLLGVNTVHRYVYNGTAVSSMTLTSAMVEGATYQVTFSLSGAQALGTTTVPSFVQLNPNGSTAYGNVFTNSYQYNNGGTPAYTRTTTGAFQFSHSATSENVSGHGFSGTIQVINIRTDKNIIYTGGGTTGFATGSAWWSDATTVWATIGTLTTSVPFATWNVFVRRVS